MANPTPNTAVTAKALTAKRIAVMMGLRPLTRTKQYPITLIKPIKLNPNKIIALCIKKAEPLIRPTVKLKVPRVSKICSTVLTQIG